ncbi:aa3-type cytochrome c oxidase subunit IV [Sphingopyxis witflariensis]|uniref:aa3-type cytochrome c oxidase subunit IV n=1 Tax=Sphingopyxis witflariensis TaxID=173675 RepID=UPI001181922D|nr:aa3-type cytochrome c oxidase subunit IV [Sphingopyxis witflariensis]
MAKTGATSDSDDSGPHVCAPDDEQGDKVMAQQEMKAAEDTYAGFISMFKIGSAITAVIAVFVVLLIS